MERWPRPLRFCEGVAYRLIEPHGSCTAGAQVVLVWRGQMLGGVKRLTHSDVSVGAKACPRSLHCVFLHRVKVNETSMCQPRLCIRISRGDKVNCNICMLNIGVGRELPGSCQKMLIPVSSPDQFSWTLRWGPGLPDCPQRPPGDWNAQPGLRTAGLNDLFDFF